MSTVQTNISKQSVQESLKELATVVDGVCEALYKLAAIDPYFARKEVQRQAGKWGADLDAIWHNLKAADFDPNEWLEGRKNAMSAPVTAAKPATVPANRAMGLGVPVEFF